MASLSDLQIDFGQENNTAILMITCWKFRQVWNPFFILFKKYWSDRPYRTIMINDIGTHDDADQVISAGSDLGWASNLLNALRQIKEDRLIVFQEDFLLTSKVDTETVRKLVKYSRDNDIGCLRLCPCPGPTGKWKDEFLGTIGLNDSYRVSLQLAIWDKSVFTSLLMEGESAWDLEGKGGERSKHCNKPFLSLWRSPQDTPDGPIRYFITAVTRGTWEKGAIELLKKENIDTSNLTNIIK